MFHAWLAKLISLLTPRGVLCFSVRDAALTPEGEARPVSGIAYVQASENADLGTDIYGTTYTDAAFVRRALRIATGDERPLRRLPRALANEQDLYIVAADPQRDLSGLAAFRRGPWGWLDRRDLSRSGELRLQVWAASLDDGTVTSVEIDIDGRMLRCVTGIAPGCERGVRGRAVGSCRLGIALRARRRRAGGTDCGQRAHDARRIGAGIRGIVRVDEGVADA